MSDTARKPLHKNPLIYGLLFTALIIFGVVVLANLEHCSPNPNRTMTCEKKYLSFLKSGPNEIGDTLAGIASTLAFLWIIVTVWLQSQELTEQRKEMARATRAAKTTTEALDKQLFETTFFSILATLNSIIESIDLVDARTQKITTGRDCFRVFYTRLNRAYKKSSGSEEVKLAHAYQTFWKSHESELAHYFRFLYRAFKILEENKYAQNYHSKLLRSQLSEQELLLIFYSSVTPQGRNFQKLAVRFELFDNMPVYKLLDGKHARLIDERAYGKNRMLKPAPLHKLEKDAST